MRAIDTNVLARYALNDDPVQSPIAAAVIAEGVFVPVTVLLELSWLLTSRYRQAPDIVASIIAEIVALPSVTVASPAKIEWALKRFSNGADFADMVHLIESGAADSFATFDQGIPRDAGRASPLPIEILG